jgi:hypothetical protein
MHSLHTISLLTATNRWNTDIMQFDIFRHIRDVDALELIFLRALNWKLWTSDETYSEYETAVLKPLLPEEMPEARPAKRRRSLTATSNSNDAPLHSPSIRVKNPSIASDRRTLDIQIQSVESADL